MSDDIVEIDVRPLLEQGRSPLPLIMNTAGSMQPGERFRLLTSWEPLPLYDVLGRLGFEHTVEQKGEELWIIDFARTGDSKAPPNSNPPCIL